MSKYLVLLVILLIGTPSIAQYTYVDAFPNLPNSSNCTDITNSGDGTNRLFILDQRGKIWVFKNDPQVSSRKLFLDITDRVSQSGSELGFLGIAFHPDFKNNGFFYVNYTSSDNNVYQSHVVRFSVSKTNPDTADKASANELLTVWQPYQNHNGGCVKFGPDGYLYLSFGDGGSGGDPGNRAQNLDTLLGKILRIDVNDTAGGKKFGIPASNPFASSPSSTRRLVYAFGLRNVWRFNFDPQTNRIWAGDVGQNLYEEIDIIESGENYGWHIMEGFHCYSPSSGCDSTGLTPPIWEYSHQNSNISITGGYVYRGTALPGLVGKYIYADYGSGRIWALDPSNLSAPTNTLLIDKASTTKLVSAFGIDENKELYVVIYGAGGRIYKLQSTQTIGTPTLLAPHNDSTNVHSPVTFSWQTVTNAKNYEIMVALSSSFTSAVKDSTGITPTSATFALSAGTKYYWRVRAFGDLGAGNWSSTWSFTTFAPDTAKPPVPILISPKHDSNFVTIAGARFIWHRSQGAATYNIQFSNNQFADILADSVITDTSLLAFSAIGETGKEYWWRVRACNDNGCSGWSEARRYTVAVQRVEANDAHPDLDVKVRPNPFGKTAEILVTSPRILSARIEIFDAAGIRIRDLGVKLLRSGENDFTVDLDESPAASYFVIVSAEGKHSSFKIIKE